MVLQTCIRAYLLHTTQHHVGTPNTDHRSRTHACSNGQKSMWQGGCPPPAPPGYNTARHTHITQQSTTQHNQLAATVRHQAHTHTPTRTCSHAHADMQTHTNTHQHGRAPLPLSPMSLFTIHFQQFTAPLVDKVFLHTCIRAHLHHSTPATLTVNTRFTTHTTHTHINAQMCETLPLTCGYAQATRHMYVGQYPPKATHTTPNTQHMFKVLFQ